MSTPPDSYTSPRSDRHPVPGNDRPDRPDLRLHVGDPPAHRREVVAREWFRHSTEDQIARVAADERSVWSRDAALELTRRRKLAEANPGEGPEDTAAPSPITAEERLQLLAALGLSEGGLEELGLGSVSAALVVSAPPVAASTGPNVSSSSPTASTPRPLT